MEATAPFTVQEDFFTVSDTMRIFFRDYRPAAAGDRVPVLGIGGFWRNGADLGRLAQKLAPERRVIAPDMRGRGRSSRSRDAADYRFDHLVSDMWRLLDDLGIERAVMVGTVLGGFMAIRMAAERPARVAGLVLNDVGTQTSSPGSHAMVKNLDFEEYSLDEAVAKVKRQHGPYLTEFSASDWQAFTRQGYAESSPGRYVRDFDPLTQVETDRFKSAEPDFVEEFRKIEVPIAILRGEHSEYMPAERAERMAAVNRHAEVTTVTGRAHWPMMDEPQSLEAIGRVLRSADAGS